MTEADLQAAVTDHAQLMGWAIFHARPARTTTGWATPVQYQGAGFPDLVLVRERVVWAELKSQRGRLSADQQTWQARLRAAGCEHYVWRPGDWPDIEIILGRRAR